MKSTKPRLLVVHSDIYDFGGAEYVALRIVHGMQDYFSRITLVHSGPLLDVDRIAARFGLKLDPAIVEFVSVPLISHLPRHFGNWALIKYASALRYAGTMAAEYDGVFTTYGECTIDHPRAIQFIHYPLFFYDRESLAHLGVGTAGMLSYLVRRWYVRLSRLIAGWRPGQISKTRTIANSQWTAGQFRRVYGASDPDVLYPGAQIELGETEFMPFSLRENRAVILGRVVPGKRIETGIEIVRRLRENHGHQLGLDIIGNASGDYAAKLESLIANLPWIRWHSGLNRTAVERLISRQKWGLHCYEFEHYGVAPAELQGLGCIVFVPDNGGQREIVENEQLRYSDAEDAIQKIDFVLNNPGTHEIILKKIERSNTLHSAAHFDREIRKILMQIFPETASV